MDDDLSRDKPHRATFREAVQKEDPTTWGTRTGEPRMVPERATEREYEHTGMRTAATDPAVPPATTTTAPRSEVAATGAPLDRDVATTYPAGASTVERDTTYVADADRTYARDVEPPVERRRFSLGATFLGWAVASFFTLVFLAILGGILGVSAADAADDGITQGDVANLGIAGIIGTLVALFLAYLIGGYAAGRISLWDGAMHGMLTVAWAVLFGVIAFALGATMGDALVNATGFAFDMSDLTTETIIGLVLGLLVSIAGAAIGGRFGERYHDKVHGRATERRRAVRGRPL